MICENISLSFLNPKALNKINTEGIEKIWKEAINDAILKSKALGD